MKTHLIVALLAGAAGTVGGAPPAGAQRTAPVALPARHAAALPTPAWAPADPADSLYRVARAALDDSDWERAASLFREIQARYPDSSYAGDALYWQAFALYRAGGTRNLRTALAALDRQRTDYRGAGTRGDAGALATRIRGALAREGDSDAAEQVTQSAMAATQARAAARQGDEALAQGGGRRGAASAIAGCSDDEDDDRVAALNALLQMDAERALPILQKVLARRDACSAPLRRKAVFLVSQKGSDQTVDILADVLRNDPDAEVRQQAVFWLGQMHNDRAATLLEGIVRDANDPELQEKAIFALSQQHGERSRAALRAIAQRESAPAALREKAIFWLGQSGGSDNQEFLRTLFGTLKDQDLQEKVLFSVAQHRSAESQRWLLDVATDARQPVEIRKKALFWAGQGGASITDLVALYRRLPDQELKEQLIFVYSQRHDREATDELLDIARNEKDHELRKKAIFWLSQSHDPRAVQFLQELIDR